MKYLNYFMLVIIFLGGCAGSTDPENDSSPAFKVDMIEHSGDTGDIVKNQYGIITDTLNYYYGTDSTFYELENNGIDAYHEGDWILLQWQHISDPATVSVEIFRFSYSDYVNSEDYLQSIEFIPFTLNNDDFYLDTFNGFNGSVTNETWLYYIKTTNADGEVAFSDTTGYQLVNKPLLKTPADGSEIAYTDTLSFEWDLNSSNSAIKYRLLLFSEFYELIWVYNLLSDEEPLLVYEEVTGEYLEPGTYIWRVDAIIERMNDLYIDGRFIETANGAESMERWFTISIPEMNRNGKNLDLKAEYRKRKS